MSHEVETGPFDGEEEAPAPRLPTSPGDIVAGKYEVERIIGAGGMGVVVAAMHLDLQERVAIKFMLPEVAMVPAAANRFLREAQAASRLKSEHIARLHDVGRLADGTPFMVMELLEGESLDQLMQREGPLPASTIVDLVLQAAEPLDEAHRLGIVHRDVKPENLFLADRPGEAPIVKLLDFGISKVQQSITITIANGMMGTATYSSPEQLKSPSGVGPSADVWSLGVILFEGLTGTLPFNGASFPEICASVLHEEPARASARRPDLPPGLDEVVQRCLAKDEASRITSIPELAAALVPFASEEGRALAARVVRRSSHRPDRGTTSTPPAAPSTPPEVSSPRLPDAAAPAAATSTTASASAGRALAGSRSTHDRADDATEGSAADADARPSFAESLTPLGMESGLEAAPMANRRRVRSAVVGSLTAGLGLVLALGVTFASTGRGGDHGSGAPMHASKVAPVARHAAARAMATVTEAVAGAEDRTIGASAGPAPDPASAREPERAATSRGTGGRGDAASKEARAGAGRTAPTRSEAPRAVAPRADGSRAPGAQRQAAQGPGAQDVGAPGHGAQDVAAQGHAPQGPATGSERRGAAPAPARSPGELGAGAAPGPSASHGAPPAGAPAGNGAAEAPAPEPPPPTAGAASAPRPPSSAENAGAPPGDPGGVVPVDP